MECSREDGLRSGMFQKALGASCGMQRGQAGRLGSEGGPMAWKQRRVPGCWAWVPPAPRLLGLRDRAWGPRSFRLSTSVSWVASLRPGLGRVRGRQGGVVEGLTRRSPSVLPQGPWPRSRSGGVAPTPAGAAAASGCICLCGAGRGTCGWRTRGRRRAAGRAP